MTRAVLDTNTIVSGLEWDGTPGAVLDAALAGYFESLNTPALLDELRRVLAYPKPQAAVGDATSTSRSWPGLAEGSRQPRPSRSHAIATTTASSKPT